MNTSSPPPAHGQEGGRDGEATDALPAPPSAATKKAIHGRKVLKRTTRLIQEDGTETVRIQYVINDTQINHFKETQRRHQEEAKEPKRKRTRERMLASGGEYSGSQSLLLSEAKRHKPLQMRQEQSKGNQEELQKQQSEEDAVRCTACDQVGHKRFELECPLYIGDEALSSSSSSSSNSPFDQEDDPTPPKPDVDQCASSYFAPVGSNQAS